MSSPNTQNKCGPTNYPELWFQDGRVSSSKITVLENVSQMKGWTSDSGGSQWQSPYPTIALLGQPCGPYSDVTTCGDFSNGDQPCYPNIVMQPAAGSGTSGSFQVQGSDGVTYTNLYNTTQFTQSYSPCNTNIGFKNVYASKAWMGIYGYTSRVWGQLDDWGYCCYGNNCGYHSYDEYPDETKYLSIYCTSGISKTTTFYDVTLASICGGCIDCGDYQLDDVCYTVTEDHSETVSSFANMTNTVDHYGNVTGDCVSGSFNCQYCDPINECNYCADQSIALMLSAGAGENVTNIYNTWCYYIQLLGLPDTISSIEGNSFTGTWHTIEYCYDDCGNLISSTTQVQYEITVTPTSLNYYSYGPNSAPASYCTSNGSCINSWIETEHTAWGYSATDFVYTDDYQAENSESLYNTGVSTVSATLSNTYTASEVYDELVNLLAEWNFGDPEVYPWRQDENKTIGPFVTVDEGAAIGPSITCPPPPTTSFTGNVKGAPGPAGIDRIWNPEHVNWCVCTYNTDEGPCQTFNKQDVGQWNSDPNGLNGFVPRATQWTDFYMSNNIPDGAFCGNPIFNIFPDSCNGDIGNTATVGAFMACKYAEVVYPKQSYNWFRPCGTDRYQISESTNRCIVSGSSTTSSNSVLIDPSSGANDITTSDTVWICGTGVVDGIWNVQNSSGNNITLNQQLLNGSVLPSEYLFNCGTGYIAKLRYQNGSGGISAPAICGVLGVSSAYGNPVTCSFQTDTYFVKGDEVTVSGFSGMPSFNGTQTVLDVIGTTEVVFNHLTSSGEVYIGGGTMISVGAPDISWNTNQPFGNFTIMNWSIDNRTTGEYYRLSSSYSYLTQQTECDGTTPCPLPSVPSAASAGVYQADCGMNQYVRNSPICEQSCFAFQTCVPCVAYFSPNSESFQTNPNISSATNFGFTFPGIDEQYGVLWQGIVSQMMPDPLAQPPACVCSSDEGVAYNCGGGPHLEPDNGSCQPDTDTVTYYPAAAMYEAVCSAPDGAPPLPTGVYVGCLNPNEFSEGSCPQGNICNPPTAPGTYPYTDGCFPYLVNVYSAPWVQLLNEETCICDQGSFYEIYQQNGICCQNDLTIDAP